MPENTPCEHGYAERSWCGKCMRADAPERTPLSERIRRFAILREDAIQNLADEVAALEQATYTCPRCDGEWKAVEGELRALTTRGENDD